MFIACNDSSAMIHRYEIKWRALGSYASHAWKSRIVECTLRDIISRANRLMSRGHSCMIIPLD